MEFTLPPYTTHPTALAGAVNPWAQDDLGFAEEWPLTEGEGISVGIIDTGIDQQHAQIGDFVDCIEEGRDFTGAGSYWDDQGHGSHVAGLMFARTIPERKFRGGCNKARLFVAKCLDRNGSGQSDWIAAGIRWLADRGCLVINGSFGAPEDDPTILGELERFAKGGGIFVAAAGNDGGQLNSPGRSPWSVATGAYDEQRVTAPFSCRGEELDAAAPGVRIVSCGLGGSYQVLSGTSMASPLLAAQVVLYQSFRQKNNLPLLDLAGIMSWIKRKAKDAGDPGHDPLFGEGILSGKDIFELEPVAPTAPDQPGGWAGDESVLFPGVVVHKPAKPGDDYSVKLG